MSTLVSFSNQLADAAAAAAPWVVQVQGRRRPASGVVVGADLVLTTSLALGRNDAARVRTPDGRELPADLAGWDPATHLVLLRTAGLDLAPATRAETEARVGHIALGVARSWSNALTATFGLVSVIGGPLRTGPGRTIARIIRTSAPMHSGFAGGALVDVTGRLIGIATATAIRGLVVVIPADIALDVASRLAEHGTTPRGYLGIAGQPVRLNAARTGGDAPSRALLVAAVIAGSPADEAGILVGDVMTAFDGAPVQSPVDLLELLSGERVGRTVTVQLLRGGEARELAVTVRARSSE